MTWLASILPTGAAEYIRLAVLALAVGLLCFLLGQCDGAKNERHVWEKAVETEKLKAEKAQRQADTFRAENMRLQQAAIVANREEVDNATKDIPDQAPSARQRARACLELQRQAAAHRKPQPAC